MKRADEECEEEGNEKGEGNTNREREGCVMMAKIRKYDNCGSCERVRERERGQERGSSLPSVSCYWTMLCVCVTGCECGLQAAFVIASQLSCGPQLVDGIQSVCPVRLSVCFPMQLTVRLTTSHSPSASLLLPYSHLPLSLCCLARHISYAIFGNISHTQHLPAWEGDM